MSPSREASAGAASRRDGADKGDDETMTTLFTVQVTENVGFTDKLTTLASLHDIGVRCGYEFRLKPFGGDRSGGGFWSHYDMARMFPVLSPEEAGLPTARVDLSREQVQAAGVGSLSDLRSFIVAQVPSGTGLVVFRGDGVRFLLGKFAWDRSVAMETFHARMRELFRPTYSWPGSQGLRVLLHIRCGDVTDIPLVGPISYRTWDGTTSIARPFWPTPFHGARLVIDTVRALSAPAPVQFRVHTDGYARTRNRVSAAAGHGGTITHRTRDVLLRSIDIHEETAGHLLRAPDVAFSSGESFDSLRQLIDEVQQADLIVVTHAQRMIPKFLALLGPRETVPGMLLLDRSPRQVVAKRAVRMDESVATLITLSGHGDPLSPLRVFLAGSAVPRFPRDVASLVDAEDVGPYCVPEVESLAAKLEAKGFAVEAGAIHRWLAALTDDGPASLAGIARCLPPGDLCAKEAALTEAAKAAERCAAEYRAAIDWARCHGYPQDANALRAEVRRLLGPDAEFQEPDRRAHPRRQ